MSMKWTFLREACEVFPKNFIRFGSGVARLNRESGESRSGPATVAVSCLQEVTEAYALGRRRRAMSWSQENCLIDNRRLTYE